LKEFSKNNIPTFQFFQIKKCPCKNINGENVILLQFIDISAKIFYDDLKAQEDFTTLINSTISHEMRNPLNSIISQCKVIKRLHSEIV
jgi:signal transduction histidine kinase